MKKEIDITKYEDFIEAGFKECDGCGWAFDPAEFDRHNCDDMNKPMHNHIDGVCKEGCPAFGILEMPVPNKKLSEES